ncbi:2-aminoethylphosphonate--pyruvate transaminase [Lysinibacillus sp. KU-BSD001]|uniref:2-aminoethylphosphonate--pyruvate transaminase n=1 Tax=Lysinibacillus sp. KU-BSD001 TaxID=3141328 RepID=UPI0036E04C9E
MNRYKLLTPGPLTTSETVRQQMLEDRCTWDDEYKQLTQTIRHELLTIAGVKEEDYTTVLMQGSGSFVVESVLTSTIRATDKVLIMTNGAYGERLAQMAQRIGLSHVTYATPYNEYPDMQKVEDYLMHDASITHIAIVHCETTTGILNPIEQVSALATRYGKTFIVDAMSSFGGVPIPVGELHIDYLISSANKCIQGVPGFGFVIAKKASLQKCEGVARSLSLDLYDQWKVMEVDGKWRYTSPTHVVAAFLQAIKELNTEGGVQARFKRYAENNQLLRDRLAKVGFDSYIESDKQSPIITAFLYPNAQFQFNDFYEEMKAQGFVLYPGKLTDIDTFRIGNIGEIYREDIEKLCTLIENYMAVTTK